jgi:hypothetical protein
MHGVADLLQPSDKAVGCFMHIRAIEVSRPKVMPFGAVAQHMPSGGEHGGGHRDDGFLDAATGAKAVELGLQVAALDLHGRPGRLREGGLEPFAAGTQSRAAALAGALIVARTQAGPGQQMARGGEARHVNADLGHDHMGAHLAQSRHGAQPFGGASKRFEPKTHLLLDRGDGLIQRIDMTQVKLEHEAVMGANVAAQRLAQLGAAGLDATVDARDQALGISLAVDDGLRHCAPALAQEVAEHDAELEVGVFEHFLDALDVCAPLAHELLAGARERAQFLHGDRGHEARPDQAVGKQVGQPRRVIDVGLAPRHVLDMRRVGWRQLEVAFQDMPDRLPVHASRLHGDVLDAKAIEPIDQGQQPRGGRGKSPDCLQRRALAADAHASHDALLAHVQAGAARVDDFHNRLLMVATSACGPRHRNLNCVLSDAKPLATVWGARGAAGPTRFRVHGAKKKPTSMPDAALSLQHTFHASWVAQNARWNNYVERLQVS